MSQSEFRSGGGIYYGGNLVNFSVYIANFACDVGCVGTGINKLPINQ